jgi:hypothetical protein
MALAKVFLRHISCSCRILYQQLLHQYRRLHGLESTSNTMATSTSIDPQEPLPVSSAYSSIRQDNSSATEGNELPRAGTALSNTETHLESMSVSILVDMLSSQGHSITGTEEKKTFKSAKRAMRSVTTEDFRARLRKVRTNMFDTTLQRTYTKFISGYLPRFHD